DSNHHREVGRKSDAGENAKLAIGNDQERKDEQSCKTGGKGASRNRILAKAWTDGAFLDDVEIGRKCAGAKPNRQIICALYGETVGNTTRSDNDRLAYMRCRDHLVVEDDRKKTAVILLGCLSVPRGALIVEAERNGRFVGALVKRC